MDPTITLQFVQIMNEIMSVNSCFTQCVRSFTSPDLTKKKQQCVDNCGAKFIDANIRMMKKIVLQGQTQTEVQAERAKQKNAWERIKKFFVTDSESAD